MKNLKKLASIALAAVMTLALMVPAFAAENKGSITLNNAEEGKSYSAWKMFDAENGTPYTEGEEIKTPVLYSVKNESPWYAFVTGTGAGAKYVDLFTGDGKAFTAADATAKKTAYVQLKTSVTISEGNVLNSEGQIIADFARAALAYAQDEGIEATKTSAAVAEGAKTATIEGLDYGYYVVNSTEVGTMCALTVNEDSQTITLKADKPTIEKTSDKASAEVGGEVTFTLKVNALPGAKDYVVHDVMGSGLAIVANSVTVNGVDAESYTVNYNPGHNHNTEKKTGAACTFTVTFDQDYLDSIKEATQIEITYKATVTAAAVDDADNNDTINEAALNYGPNDGWTKWVPNKPDPKDPDPDNPNPDDPDIETYYFDLVKTNSANALLDGAQFKLYDAAKDGNEIKLTLVEKDEGNYYRPAVENETPVQYIEVTNGQVQIKGLSSANTYYLEETVAPTGYNLLTERVAVKLVASKEVDKEQPDGSTVKENIDVGSNLTAIVTPGTGDDLGTYTSGGVQVINMTGAEMPETGGIGTTIFYAVGGLLVVGAGILLVVKKRMGAE